MHDEDWQVYAQNGSPISGSGAKRAQFKERHSLIMGNAHVWFWRVNDRGSAEIMLQKRSQAMLSRPGWYHISAGGHINVGESSVEAATREVQEEMGISINSDDLYYVYSGRIIPQDPNNIVNVFLYELDDDSSIKLVDGEVDSFEWRSFDNWKEITQSPDSNMLVPQSAARFELLTQALEYLLTMKKSQKLRFNGTQ